MNPTGSEEPFIRAFWANPDVFAAVVTPDGHVVSHNPAMATLLQKPGSGNSSSRLGQVGGDAPGFLDPARIREVVGSGGPRRWEMDFDGRGYEITVAPRRADSGQVHSVAVVAWLRPPREPILGAAASDPRDHDGARFVETEQALEARERQLRQLGDNIPGGIVYQLVGDDRGHRRFAYVSAGVERMFGVRAAEVMTDATLLYRMILEEDVSLLQAKELEALQRQSAFSHECRFRRPDGETRWMLLNSAPSRRGDGTVVWDGVALDITERRQLEQRLRQASKLEGIGRLAGGIAHEFNNILAATMMGLGLLRAHAAGSEPRELLSELEGLSRRGAALVSELLAFSRQSVMERLPLDLADLVACLRESLAQVLGDKITLHVSIPPVLPRVNADRVLLEQVITHLAQNARASMVDGGRLSLALTTTEVDASAGHGPDGVRPGRFLCLTVSDTGHGIDEVTLRNLFEPFHTTQDPSSGRGLGLAMVHGIVRQHEGWIEVESQVGQGASFRIFLPVIEPAMAPGPAGPAVAAGGVQRGTILLVEDEVALRRVTRTLLTRNGYRVLEAGDAREALNVWNQFRTEIEVVFTDLVMPGPVSGIDFARRVAADRPGVRVVITSGYHAGKIDPDELASRGIVYLPKPCPPEILIAALDPASPCSSPVSRS